MGAEGGREALDLVAVEGDNVASAVKKFWICFHVVTITQVKVKVKGKSVFIFFFYMLNLLSIGDQSRLTMSAKLSLMSSIESIETSRSPPS